MAETDNIQSSMQALENKMESLSGIMKTVQDDVDEVYMLFSDKDSEYSYGASQAAERLENLA